MRVHVRYARFITAFLITIVLLGQGQHILLIRIPNAYAAGGKWTFMMYIAYDNDLSDRSGLASSIFSRLESVGSQAGVEIVVLLDEKGSNTAYYHIESNTATQRTDYPASGDIDATNYQNLKTFISWTASQYPASHYILVLHSARAQKLTDDIPVFYVSKANALTGSESWSQLPGKTLSFPAVAGNEDTICFTVRGTDEGIYWMKLDFRNLEATAWRRLSGSTLSAPSIALSGGTMYIAVRGTDNGIYLNSINTASGFYSTWRRVSGTTAETPYITYFCYGGLFMAAAGSYGGIYIDALMAYSEMV